MTDPERSRTETASADRDWFGGRRWTGIAALGVIIVVLLCVVIIVSVHHGGGHKTARSGSRATTAMDTVSTARIIPGPSLTTTVPSAAPSGVTWSVYEGVALPRLAGVGPASVNGALATGYADTPLGALLAVANDTYRFVLAGPQQWRAVVDATIAPGPGKQEAVRVLSAANSSEAPSEQAGVRSQIAGFQFVSYTPNDAVIQLATRDLHGTIQVLPQQVTWSGSDWLLVLRAEPVQPQIAPSLAGFIPWGGV